MAPEVSSAQPEIASTVAAAVITSGVFWICDAVDRIGHGGCEVGSAWARRELEFFQAVEGEVGDLVEFDGDG